MHSLFFRFQKRANVWAEENRAQTKVQKEVAANAKIECEKAIRDAKWARDEAENAKIYDFKEKLAAKNN